MSAVGKFAIGERVLCFHGPLIYEAKCLKTESRDNELKYYIHYAGWNKNWDEWVPESRVLKYNDQNLQKQKDLHKQHKIAPQKTKKVATPKNRKSSITSETGKDNIESGEKEPSKTTPMRERRFSASDYAQIVKRKLTKSELEKKVIIPNNLQSWLKKDKNLVCQQKKEVLNDGSEVGEVLNNVEEMPSTNNGQERNESCLPLSKRFKYLNEFNTNDSAKVPGESVSKRDDFSVYGEHVANKLRRSNKSEYEIAVAQRHIDEILFKLTVGGLSPESYFSAVVPQNPATLNASSAPMCHMPCFPNAYQRSPPHSMSAFPLQETFHDNHKNFTPDSYKHVRGRSEVSLLHKKYLVTSNLSSKVSFSSQSALPEFALQTAPPEFSPPSSSSLQEQSETSVTQETPQTSVPLVSSPTSEQESQMNYENFTSDSQLQLEEQQNYSPHKKFDLPSKHPRLPFNTAASLPRFQQPAQMVSSTFSLPGPSTVPEEASQPPLSSPALSNVSDENNENTTASHTQGQDHSILHKKFDLPSKRPRVKFSPVPIQEESNQSMPSTAISSSTP